MIWLILLIFIVVMVVFVMHFRRQAKAREAASAERMKAILDQARTSGASGADGAKAAPLTPAAAPREARPQAVQTVSGITLRAPLLNAEQAAVFRQLNSALPDHEMFAQVSLAAFVAPGNDVTGFAREAAARRLTDTPVDFLVCSAALTPLAVVQCGARSGKAAEGAAYAQACAASLGVRWVELSPQALPPPRALRQQVLGA